MLPCLCSRRTKLIGIIAHLSEEVRPFTGKQIELLSSFANQAVIAIENVRLLNELRARTTELAQSVEELRALGEVSQTVNSSLDLETVLGAIVTKAVQLSGTDAGAIYDFDEARRRVPLALDLRHGREADRRDQGAPHPPRRCRRGAGGGAACSVPDRRSAQRAGFRRARRGHPRAASVRC